ncbi:MAG: ABC transporter substrate-binding protein [Armatimonadota bacterium]|nr:ABC transporter substrate-binding protein [Armatimonadota bacterium]
MLVALVALALALAGAASPSSSQPAADTIVWADDRESLILDPRVSQSRHEAQIIMHVFDALIFRDFDGKFYPSLAEKWEHSKDGKSMTFTLRRDVKFHDGTDFTADAVKFTFDSIQDPKLGSQAAIDFLGPYESTEVIDRYTVRVNWKQPFAAAVANLSNPWLLGIVSPAAVQKLGNAAFARAPVGTGPYKFVEFVPRVRVVLERNDQYRWAPKAFRHQGPPRVRRLVFLHIPDSSTRMATLEKGESDVVDAVPPIDVRRFKGTRDFDVVIGDVSGIPFSYLLNTSLPPLDDVRVRQAIMYGLDRPKIVEQVFFGVAKPAFGPITPTTPGYWPGVEKMYQYNPAKSRELLDAAGWRMGPGGIRVKNGQPLEVNHISLLQPELGVPVQAAMKDIGIKYNFETVTKARQDELVMNNQYNVGEIRWVAVDPSVIGIPFYSRNIPAPGKFKFNWSRFGSPELDRLILQGDTAVDPGRRAEILARIQKTVLDRGLIFPFNISPQPIAYRRSVQGMRFAQGFWQILFYEATVSR